MSQSVEVDTQGMKANPSKYVEEPLTSSVDVQEDQDTSNRGVKRERTLECETIERGTVIVPEYFSIDVEELPTSLIISAEMPGLKSGSLGLKVADDERLLTIVGERDLTLKRTKKAKVVMNEIQQVVYERSFYLPENVDVNSIASTYSDGIVRLEFRKKAPSYPRKTIRPNKRCIIM